MAYTVASHSLLSSLTPFLRQNARPLFRFPFLRRIRLPLLASKSFAIPILAVAGVSSVLRDIWESILKAVPKKKTSHMKKRHRQMAGKALKDVTSLNKCSSCGRVKRAHVLCPYCALAITRWIQGKRPTAEA